MKNTFKKQFEANDFKFIENVIRNHFAGRFFQSHKGEIRFPSTFKEIDQILGTAYTSTSTYAGYWICNIELYFDTAKKWHYTGFSIDEISGYVIAEIQDKDENSIYFSIS